MWLKLVTHKSDSFYLKRPRKSTMTKQTTIAWLIQLPTFHAWLLFQICTMTILDDSQSPSVEGNETFQVYLTSVLRAKLVSPHHAIVTINDTMDDSKSDFRQFLGIQIFACSSLTNPDVSPTCSPRLWRNRVAYYTQHNQCQMYGPGVSRLWSFYTANRNFPSSLSTFRFSTHNIICHNF